MPIDEIEFGKLMGLVEGMDKKLDSVTEHFLTHAKEDNLRFEAISTSIALQKGKIQTGVAILSTAVSAAVAGVTAYLTRGH